jgi:hypothetical protein
MPSSLISLEEWPLVIVTFLKSTTSEEYDRYIREIEQIRRRREPWAYILHARNTGPMTAAHRQAYTASARRAADLIRQYLRCAAFVFTNPIVRGCLTAVQWLAPPPYPWKIAGTMEEARAWVDEMWPPDRRQ